MNWLMLLLDHDDEIDRDFVGVYVLSNLAHESRARRALLSTRAGVLHAHIHEPSVHFLLALTYDTRFPPSGEATW